MIGRRNTHDAQSFEEAWTTRRPHDEHIADLVKFAEDLCAAATVEPSSQFSTSLRARLMAEATTVLTPMPRAVRSMSGPARPTHHPVRRRVASVTAAVVASVGVVGLVSSSASAVPGEMLYPIKRNVESVGLALHREDASRGVFELERASERLAEVRQLSASGSSQSDRHVAGTLGDFAAQAESGSGSLFSDFKDSGSEQSIRAVNKFAVSATADLAVLSEQLPASASSAFDSALKTINDLSSQATSLCSACVSVDVESLVSAMTGLARQTPVDRPTKKASRATPAEPADAGSTPAGTSPTRAPAAGVVPPLPTPPSVSAPEPSDGLLDPIVGGLLGDDNQKGLVPDVLGGLSSTTEK